jgi:hypothetical protein
VVLHYVQLDYIAANCHEMYAFNKACRQWKKINVGKLRNCSRNCLLFVGYNIKVYIILNYDKAKAIYALGKSNLGGVV